MILGTYDAYEGIAILLSPEAADKLQIVKGKDVYVKVQKKQPISYEEAVATSRNKKATQSQIVDTDKDSSVLPGQTEQLVNDVIASKNNFIFIFYRANFLSVFFKPKRSFFSYARNLIGFS